VSEDPFGDLGGGNGRSAGERLAERDRTHPEPVRRPEVPRPGNRYAWLVGILMLMVLVVVLFKNTLPHKGEGTLGPRAGRVAPAFAAPLATGNLEGDANVCQKNHCPRNSGPVPACQIRSRDVLNVCQLRHRPMVLTFIFDRGADCNPQVDRVQAVSRSFPRVSFAVVYFSHKHRDALRAIVDRRGWRMPVGVDRDGAVANLYGVGVCPTTVFSGAGGRVVATKLGELTEQELRAEIRRVARRKG
jgi:AhpC/TSA family